MAQARFTSLVVAGAIAALIACGPPTPPPPPEDGGTEVHDGGVACTVEAPTECPAPAPRYDDVSPIIQARCVVCHDGDWGGPWPLTDYPHVADWQNEIRGNLLDCSMPPADAGFTMPDEERTAILTWIRCGAPQ